MIVDYLRHTICSIFNTWICSPENMGTVHPGQWIQYFLVPRCTTPAQSTCTPPPKNHSHSSTVNVTKVISFIECQFVRQPLKSKKCTKSNINKFVAITLPLLKT